MEDEVVYVWNEVKDEYEIPKINSRWEKFTSVMNLPNFFALVVAAKWFLLVFFFGGAWVGFS